LYQIKSLSKPTASSIFTHLSESVASGPGNCKQGEIHSLPFSGTSSGCMESASEKECNKNFGGGFERELALFEAQK
jgi:hypothetical protein